MMGSTFRKEIITPRLKQELIPPGGLQQPLEARNAGVFCDEA